MWSALRSFTWGISTHAVARKALVMPAAVQQRLFFTGVSIPLALRSKAGRQKRLVCECVMPLFSGFWVRIDACGHRPGRCGNPPRALHRGRGRTVRPTGYPGDPGQSQRYARQRQNYPQRQLGKRQPGQHRQRRGRTKRLAAGVPDGHRRAPRRPAQRIRLQFHHPAGQTIRLHRQSSRRQTAGDATPGGAERKRQGPGRDHPDP